MPMTDRHARRGPGGRNAFLICLAVVTLAAVAAAALLLFGEGEAAPQPTAPVIEGFDAAARPGELDGETAGDLAEADTFTFRINSKVTVKKGKANLRIENPVENTQLMKVTLTLDDGTQIYATDFIRPYYSIESDKLDSTLKQGTYPAQALIASYDRVSRELLGETSVPVTITVE